MKIAKSKIKKTWKAFKKAQLVVFVLMLTIILAQMYNFLIIQKTYNLNDVKDRDAYIENFNIRERGRKIIDLLIEPLPNILPFQSNIEEIIKEPIKEIPTFKLNQGVSEKISLKSCVTTQITRANGTVELPSTSC